MESVETKASGGPVQVLGNSVTEERACITWTAEKTKLLKDILAHKITDDELRLFKYVCKKTGLDPFMRQIHIVKRWDASRNREVATFQTGIDGYRVIAERSCEYAGSDKPVFVYLTKKGVEKLKSQDLPVPQVNLQSAAVTVYRIVQGQRVGFTATAYWDEYAQYGHNGELTRFWSRMPRAQLAKCAEALALRKAFPANLSGLYTNEEMQQAENPVRDANGSGARSNGGYLREMASTREGISYCWFCRKRHIKTGESIVQASIETPGVNDPVWGAKTCWKEPKVPERDKPQEDTKVRNLLHSTEQVAREIKVLENQLSHSGKWSQLSIENDRQVHCGRADIRSATLPGLKNYLIFLEKRVSEAQAS